MREPVMCLLGDSNTVEASIKPDSDRMTVHVQFIPMIPSASISFVTRNVVMYTFPRKPGSS